MAAAEIEEKKYRPRADQSAQSIESDKRTLREAFKHSIYDVFLWLAGAPIGLWWTSRLAPAIQRITSSAFLQAAFYLYLFVATLFGVRILFHYARWIWPLVEFTNVDAIDFIFQSGSTVGANDWAVTSFEAVPTGASAAEITCHGLGT